MPVTLPDPLCLDPEDREVEIPVDPSGESRETVRVTLRAIPAAKWTSLSLVADEARKRLRDARDPFRKTREGEALSLEDCDALGVAIHAIEEANREIARWGVASHRAEDFIVAGAPAPFETETARFNGKPCEVVSRRTLALYGAAGLIGPLSSAVALFQEGTVETPEEIWEAHRKAAEEAEKDAARAVGVFLTRATKSKAAEEAAPAPLDGAAPPVISPLPNGSPSTSA